jgi:hypothetical protein
MGDSRLSRTLLVVNRAKLEIDSSTFFTIRGRADSWRYVKWIKTSVKLAIGSL